MKIDKEFAEILIGKQIELNTLLRFAKEEAMGDFDVDAETELRLRQMFPNVFGSSAQGQ